ncbi:Homeodomain-like domain-containing protein [Streptomyces sp. Ag109_O5-1]|uniref:helix-turn-helix domain-containing protein n=1 Tax=Streptomyces sp. Ag109_O5-1 TaxID=1938851 RepID=UPI000F5075A5|nr:helix-turn-helix domain-containing protein [Streptomyces sp. Ag109_O5-1]RPE43282.1 Homeodomain-like domain-containing protein [Streptomyces sp. Ag109_O5-1]
MAHPQGKYQNFEGLREQAVALRRAGLSRRQIRDRLHVDNNDILNRLLEGEPPPDWTKRPNAKDDLRARARELRLQGWTYNQIQAELGCSKSSVSLWVRDLPHPEPTCTPEEQRARMNAGLARLHASRDLERAATKREAAASIGELSDRELFVAGVTLYWAEGSKDKPYRRTEVLQFINSDPNVIKLFLRWLDLLEVTRDRLTLRVSIHETADVRAAEEFWADVADVEVSAFSKATLKKHNPRTVRKNTGDSYHGCLVIYVRQSADLYRRMEGAWYGIVGGATRRPD